MAANENYSRALQFEAGGAFTAPARGLAVAVNSTGKAVLANTAALHKSAVGVLRTGSAVASGNIIDVICEQGSVVVCQSGAAITQGSLLTLNTKGEVINATASSKVIFGIALEGTTEATDNVYIPVLLNISIVDNS